MPNNPSVFQSPPERWSLVAKENRHELLQEIYGQLARIPGKKVGVQARVKPRFFLVLTTLTWIVAAEMTTLETEAQARHTGATSRFPERSQQRYLLQLNPL